MAGVAGVKRRRIVVERGAQVRLTAWALAQVLVCLALTLLIVLLPALLRLAAGEGAAAAAARDFVYLEAPAAAAVAAMLLVVALNSLALTHRVFGPLARLRRVLRFWRDGEAWPPELRVRPRDFHAPLFEDFNAAAAALDSRLAAARAGAGAAAQRADQLAQRLGEGPEAAEARQLAEGCRETLAHLERLGRRGGLPGGAGAGRAA